MIYLDLNHWIESSKAHSGHRDGEKHRLILDQCLEAVGDGTAVFPLSEYIYIEILKITNYRQRRDLCEVIEQICRYMVVTSPSVVATHEVEAVLDMTVGYNPAPLNTTNYLDWGVERAYGKMGGIRIESPSGEDVTEDARRTCPRGPAAFDAVLSDAQLELNKRAIEGPTPQREPGLRALGWNPEAIVRMAEQKASEEIAQVQRFNDYPNWRRGRIRDVITAREVSLEIGDIFEEGFAARGTRAADHFYARKPDDLRSIYGAMPSLDVAVTDRSMWSHVTRNKLHDRYNTIVIPQLAKLPNHM
ncbi:MAG: hypothetical protein J4G14_14120 [Dehalococcoidia bacterium]|nr:hypothetical protein [Dehalococcoidia bacterium]